MTERGHDSGTPDPDVLSKAYEVHYAIAGGDPEDQVSIADRPDAIAVDVGYLRTVLPDASDEALAALTGLVHGMNPLGKPEQE